MPITRIADTFNSISLYMNSFPDVTSMLGIDSAEEVSYKSAQPLITLQYKDCRSN